MKLPTVTAVITAGLLLAALVGVVAYLGRSEPTTITVTQRAGWYVASVGGPQSRVLRLGRTAHEAAAGATQLMLQYAAENPRGGELVAPQEVLDLVPAHLHQVRPAGDAP